MYTYLHIEYIYRSIDVYIFTYLYIERESVCESEAYRVRMLRGPPDIAALVAMHLPTRVHAGEMRLYAGEMRRPCPFPS